MGARITVLGGCGAVGTAAVRTLVSVPDFDSVVIADINIERANELIKEIGSDKLSAIKIDAHNPEDIKNALRDTDVVLNCIGPFYTYGPSILKTVIDLKKNYVDVNDDVDATREVLKLDAGAKEAGITALIGMGSSPGITNLLVKFAAEQLLDEVETVDIYHAHGGEPFEGPGVIAHRFHSMSIDIPVFIDGQYKTARFNEESGKALLEVVDFEKLGKYDVYPYPHPETITLPSSLKGVKRVTNKGTVLPPEYFQLTIDAVKLGLADEQPLIVKGVEVSPHEFAIAFIIKKREEILKKVDFGSQKGCVKIVVAGKYEDEPMKYIFSLASENQALGEGTGIPAALAATLLHRGKITGKGVLPPEQCVNPLDFLEIMKEHLGLESASGNDSPLIVESVDSEGNVERITL